MEIRNPYGSAGGGEAHYVVRSFKNGTYTGRMLDGKLHGRYSSLLSSAPVPLPLPPFPPLLCHTTSGLLTSLFPSGRGRYSFYTGEMYDGEWRNNKMEGAGEYTYGDGSRFKGEYKDGLKHGVGTYFPADGGEPYVAQYHNGNLIAQGSAVTFNSVDQPTVIDASTDDLVVPDEDDSSREGNTPFEKALDGFSIEKVLVAKALAPEEDAAGVGIVFQERDEGGVIVKEIIKGGPASMSKKKVKPRDFLTHVSGQDVRNADIGDVAELIKGDAGTDVEMKFVRSVRGHSRPVQLILTRQKIDPIAAQEQQLEAQRREALQHHQSGESSYSSLRIEDDPEVLKLAAHVQGLDSEESSSQVAPPCSSLRASPSTHLRVAAQFHSQSRLNTAQASRQHSAQASARDPAEAAQDMGMDEEEEDDEEWLQR
eukprot:3921795-Rhodomonas_salina.3